MGEQLREAREVRGYDLYRVERDTKIRTKYLSALEAGDFADLPGEVYTRGFLRNYATYLGLDPDEMEDQWRLETGEEAIDAIPAAKPAVQAAGQPSFAGPRPVTIRRPFRMERRHFAIIGVILIIALIGSYFGMQITRFLEYPTLSMSQPSGAETITLPAGTTTYVLKGVATPGSTVLVSWDGQEPTTLLADDTGAWSYTVQLHFGSNQFDITAKNLDTDHASKTSRIIIQVPVITPTPQQPMVAFLTPADGARVSGDTVDITGTSVSVATVSLSWTYISGPPGGSATLPPISSPIPTPIVAGSPDASPSPGPTPTTTRPAADGSFAFSVTLPPGYYVLALAGMGNDGKAVQTVYQQVIVPYQGLNVILRVTERAYVHVAGDGKAIRNTTFEAGEVLTLTLAKWFCVRTPRSSVVYVTVNGVDLGNVARYGGTHMYVDIGLAPKNIECPA